MGNTENLEKKLIENGVKNLKQFGYPNVDEENILTDLVYYQFFEKMLFESKGHSQLIDETIDNIIKKVSNG